MKNKNTTIGIVIAAIVIIGIIIFAVSKGGSSTSTPDTTGTSTVNTGDATHSVPATQTEKVSADTTKYENSELGFSVNYPSVWTVDDESNGPVFTIPVSAPSTVSTLGVNIFFVPSKCAFPAVDASSITNKSTLTAGKFTYNTITVSATKKASSKTFNYFDRMYTLEQGTASAKSCYVFSFGSITAATTDAAATAANKAAIDKADKAFTEMVKSFNFVTGPTGDSETAHKTGK